ncbi:MAG: TraR/DksA family transcriptional regulator [Candidatus Omnitrophota bacterium]
MAKDLTPEEIEKLKKKNLERFTSQELAEFKKLLLSMRDKIAGDLRHLESESLNSNQKDLAGDLSGYSFHMADMATDTFDRELNLGLASSEQNLLNLIDLALRKIVEGTFGLCEKTLKPISKKRLLAMPYARLSLEAQETEEKEKRQQP